ncbi:M50 family metallopeptidase [Mariniluteicoccus flavus]
MFWREIVGRVTETQPPPEGQVVALLGLVALGLVVLAWPATRMLVTIAHEAGHALVATLTGRRLTGIRLHTDTSGLTVSRGPARGPGMVATLAAGYVTPGLFGLASAWVLGLGYAVAMLWLLTLLFAAMLLKIRNFYGLLVMATVAVGVGAASWYLAPVHQSWLAHLICWVWLLAAPRPVLELARQGSRTSDSAQLARLTGVPAGLWTALFGVVTLGCLVGGVALLVPGVVS